QETAAPHDPTHPSRNSGQREDEDGQDVAADVDPKVVGRATEGPADRPDGGEHSPVAAFTIKPALLGQTDSVNVRVGVEDLMIARGGEYVDDCVRVLGSKARQQRTG